MPRLKHIVLDVLKPHSPSILELARTIASGTEYEVRIRVEAVDEKTETVVVDIHGEDLDYARIEGAIASLGGSVHSVDHVRVDGGD